jgi:hypothetical protein
LVLDGILAFIIIINITRSLRISAKYFKTFFLSFLFYFVVLGLEPVPMPWEPLPMLWETGKQKSLRPLCRKQGFYYASRLRRGKFSKPWAPISVRRWVIYSPGPLCNRRGGGFSTWLTGGHKDKSVQRNKLVIEFSHNPLPNVVTVTGKLAEPRWRSVTLLSLQKAACSSQSREFKVNFRHTVNPRKIATLASTHQPLNYLPGLAWNSDLCLLSP